MNRRLHLLQRCVCGPVRSTDAARRRTTRFEPVTSAGGAMLAERAIVACTPLALVPSELHAGFGESPWEPVAVDATAVKQLDVDGYTIFKNVIDQAWLEQMRTAFEAISAAEGRLAGHEARANLSPEEFEPPPGVRRLADLVNKGNGAFDGVWSWPTVLTLAGHVIRQPFKLSSLNGHEPLSKRGLANAAATTGGEPAYGTQRLHRDWGGGERNLEPDLAQWPGNFYVLNSIWCLDDWTNRAGATRMVRVCCLIACNRALMRNYHDDG